MEFKEVRMIVTVDAPEQEPRHFLMDADKADSVLLAFDRYKQTGQPEECEIAYEDSGEGGQMDGLSGETKILFSSIAGIRIASDPLGP